MDAAIAERPRRLKLNAEAARLKTMGRFESTVEYYSRYREPYPAGFFRKVAEQLDFRRRESLLDVGCGPGLLAIGFAPFVGYATGLDPEPAMIAAAEAAAAEAGVGIALIRGRIEQFSPQTAFDVVTIGRALHWLEREATLAVLRRIVASSGRVLVCGASNLESPVSPWLKAYNDVRRSWHAEAGRGARLDVKAGLPVAAWRKWTQSPLRSAARLRSRS